MSKKENKQNPEKIHRNKEHKESSKEQNNEDRDLESGDNPDERRRMSGV